MLSVLNVVGFILSALTLVNASPIKAGSSAATLEKKWNYDHKVSPKVMIISMFGPERAVWEAPLKLTAHNYSLPGLSPLYPTIGCNEEQSICIMTTGEAEINAAASTMAMFLSPTFNFLKTYWFIAGIAGINPYQGSTGSAHFARFAVQVSLQYELDARQMPSNWSSGYWNYGTKEAGIKPTELYGTEVFEVSTPLLARVMDLVKDVKLNDSAAAIAYRSKFDYAPANLPPTISQCDVATSDVYYAGTLLSEAFGNLTSLMTNGTAVYCTTAQEDNATLESLVRADKAGLADYSRVIILRTGSDYDRAPPPSSGLTAYTAFEASQGGFGIALQNLYIAGYPVIKEIVYDWQAWENCDDHLQYVNAGGRNATYYGDDFGTLRDGISDA